MCQCPCPRGDSVHAKACCSAHVEVLQLHVRAVLACCVACCRGLEGPGLARSVVGCIVCSLFVIMLWVMGDGC